MSIKATVQSKTYELKQFLDLLARDFSIPLEKRLQLIIHAGALICAIVAVQPIPFADLFILTPIQVVMVVYLNRALGQPSKENEIQELVVYLIGVVGWGVLAQQVILGLYKTILPFLGGVTTIPLVYIATYGLGFAAKTVLEARIRDRTLTKEEIKRIAEEARKQVREESGLDFTPSGLRREWDKLQQRVAKMKEYEETIARLEQVLQQPVDTTLFVRDIVPQLMNIRTRFHESYPNVHVRDHVLFLISLHPEQIKIFEEQISQIQHDVKRSMMTTVNEQLTLFQLELKGVGMLYIYRVNDTYHVHSYEAEERGDEYEYLHQLLFQQHKMKHLKDKEIREMLELAVHEAKTEISIVSPWMGEKAVNDFLLRGFEQAMKRGVVIRILYGIGSSQKSDAKRKETEAIAEHLKKRFAQYYGTLFRLNPTNTHYKLLICDDRFYLEGSFNYLSFRGDYKGDSALGLRGEGATWSDNTELLLELRRRYFHF